MSLGTLPPKTEPRHKIGDSVLVAPHFWTGNAALGFPETTKSAMTVKGIIVHVNYKNDGGIEYVVKLLEDAGYGWYKGDTYRARPFQLTPINGGGG